MTDVVRAAEANPLRSRLPFFESPGMAESDVLIVDDNAANVLLLKRLLKAAGMQAVEGCTSGHEALARCEATLPDIVLLDLHMPTLNGFAVMEQLRRRVGPDEFVPVLVLTADVDGEARRRALEAGANDFLTKPFDNVEVVLRVRNLLETKDLVSRLGTAVARERSAVSRESTLRRAAVALGAAGGNRTTIEGIAMNAATSLAKGMDVWLDVAPPDGPCPGVAGAIEFPIITHTAKYGAIRARTDRPLSPDVADALETLAAQVALALESATLAEDLRRKASEKTAAALVQHSSDVIAIVDADLRIRFHTPSLRSVLGYEADALVGARLTELVRPEQVHIAEEHFAEVASTPGAGPPVEWDMRHRDGSLLRVEAMSNNLLHDSDVEGIVVIVRDISERKAFEEGLKRQVEELRELDRIKDDLVSTVSHELRTPLTSIVGHTEMLADGDAGPISDQQARVVGIIDRNGRRLLTLIEDLLTMARVESQRLDLNLAPTDMAGLIANVRESVLPSAAARSLLLTVDVDPSLGEVVVDGSLIERALSNLMSNAIKFTPEGGTVDLSVHRCGDNVTFAVRDTGIGISAEDQKRLFTRFFRSAMATVNAIPGTGLGLAIVKEIVNGHGGAITLDSAPNAGTTVSFTIPAE